jgi:DNA uptake protein ComE-like DNA-binding protein
MLTLGTATYLELMQNEHRAVRSHGRAVQAQRLAESGIEYVKYLVGLTPAEIQESEGLSSNEAALQAIVVDDQPEDNDRGRFSIVGPAQEDGLYVGYKFGLQNESARLNVNVLLAPGAEDQAANRLMALPGMTPETADAILDWLDADEVPRENGAERDAYSQLTPAVAPRNGPIPALDELLQVRGVTPELLYGVDQNRNFLVDLAEQPRGLLVELDNTDGVLNRGWSAYLTVSSVEAMRDSAGAALLDVNGQNLQQLYNGLKTAVGDDKAKFIIVYRQHGPQQSATGQPGVAGGAPAPGNQPAAGGGAAPASGAPGGGPGAGAPGPQNPAAAPVTVAPASLQLNFDQQGATQLTSLLDLICAKVQIPGVNNAPPQLVDSPWLDNAASYRELLKLYDVAAAGSARRVAGRINVNSATRTVLASIPFLPQAAVGKIVGRREIEPDPLLSDQRHPLWLLIEGIVTLPEMRQIERYVTSGGDVFSGQSVGFFDAGPMAARIEFIVDRSGTTAHRRAASDLSALGRGFSNSQLGVEPADEAP